MSRIDVLEKKIREVAADNFDELALEVFRYQASSNSLYARYLALLGISAHNIKSPEQIPFLPISFFKTHTVKSGDWQAETVFQSSGTTGSNTSRHLVRSQKAYLENCRLGFRTVYGKDPSDFCWLALLPSYLERNNSSLICMTEHFIGLSRYSESGFFLNEWDDLLDRVAVCKAKKIPLVLLGVSFALLDLAEALPHMLDLEGVIVMETGGMKGRRKEIIRSELHAKLNKAFGTRSIHSEYGMTELFSQAYSRGKGLFQAAATMRVRAREINDPLCLQRYGKTGVLNIIDLANLHSCSFIATDDLGRVFRDRTFEVLGRQDGSDIRGCNLLLGDGGFS
jgi:hypothetical protein